MKILILRVSSIGDVIHTLPAIFLIKKKFPDAEISWIAQKKVADILHNQPFLKRIFILKNKFLSPKNWVNTLKIIKKIRKTKWDAILDFQGILKTSVLLTLLKGEKYGYDYNNARLGLTCFFTKHHTKPNYKNIIQKNLALVSQMLLDYQNKFFLHSPTIPSLQKMFTLNIQQGKHNLVKNWLEKKKIKEFIILAPNTTWESKHWPQDNWQKLFKLLLKEKKLIDNFSILLVGKDFDYQAKELAEFVIKEKINIHLCPKFDLLATSYLIKKSHLIVAPDTGLLHIADFFNKDAIGIFGPTNAKIHGPFLKKENMKNVIQIKCNHYYQKRHIDKSKNFFFPNKKKSGKQFNCMYKLSPEHLFEKILKILKLKLR